MIHYSLSLFYYVWLPLLTGLLLYIKPGKWSRYMTLAIQTVLLISVANQVLLLDLSKPVIELLSTHKVPVGMSLKLDTLSGVMVLLNQVIFLSAMIFSLHKPYMNRLFLFLFLGLQGLVNGVFLSNDLFNTYLLIEVATVVVSVLIMYKKDPVSVYDGMVYLLVNMTAMAFFLFGIGYMYKYFGVFDFTSIKAVMFQISDPQPLIVPFAFLLTGVSLKAALLPLFSWLPKAHGTASAPSIVSAILSGIFVKTEVYLFIRLSFMFSPVIDISAYYFFAGSVTVLFGYIFTIAQYDVKLILAYSTISQVGFIVTGLSGHSPVAYDGAIYHILTHGIFKSLLFISLGLLVQIYGSRDINKMTGLWWKNKALSIIILIGILSITGAPLLGGGYSKYLINQGLNTPVLSMMMTLINLGALMAFMRFYFVIFSPNSKGVKVKLPLNQYVGLGFLALMCLILGLFGDQITSRLLGTTGYFNMAQQVSKVPEFMLSFVVAFVLHALLLTQKHRFKYFRGIDLSFNSISLSILVFFMVTVAYLNVVY